ncbi:hypothetical protein [Empedobacter sp. UBA7620]|uniref:hypothetical protein n=1 Tax=Empedobacter sp. UBA7620 TaxID=1946452 RepID=UPI0025BA867F|nr:hypothetical protein [Empedobacter sp. UBA7620]
MLDKHMTVREGKTDNIYWIEFSTENNLMKNFVFEFQKFIVNKNLAVIAFDSDCMILTEEEINRGWKFENEIAYFDNLNIVELNEPIFDIYDQWFILKNNSRITNSDIFVNYSGFTIDISNTKDLLNKNIALRFWKTIRDEEVEKFILNGDNFSFGSINENDIIEIKKAWY